MRVGLCLHWREVSFSVAPQHQLCFPWFSVGAMRGKLDNIRIDAHLHLWLHIGPRMSWSWTREKPRPAPDDGGGLWGHPLPPRGLELRESIIRELNSIHLSLFTRFLPRYESHYEVIHGEVIRIWERVEPERGGDDISIERIRSVYPEGGIPIAMVPDLPRPDWPAGTETRPATGREEALSFYGIRQEVEAMRVERHRTLAEAHARAEPPTSACSRCGRTFPVADLYTGQRTQRQACDSCLTAMVAAGTAKRPAEF